MTDQPKSKKRRREIVKRAKSYVGLGLGDAMEYAEEYTVGTDEWADETERDALLEEVRRQVERVERFLEGARRR